MNLLKGGSIIIDLDESVDDIIIDLDDTDNDIVIEFDESDDDIFRRKIKLFK